MKKFFLSLCVGALAVSGLNAANITAADLVGKKCGVVLSGTNIQYPVGQLHICSDVEAGSTADEIIIKNFMGAFDLPVTVNSDNTLSLDLDKTYQGKGIYSAYSNIKIQKRDLTDAAYVNINGYTWYAEVYDLSGGTINSDKAVTDSQYFDYGYTFQHNDKDGILGFCFQFNGTNEFDYYGSIELDFFDKSATATQTLTTGDKSTYDVNVLVDLTNNKFRIDNLFNFGIMYVNTFGDNGYYDSSYTGVYGNFDPQTKKLSIDPTEIGGNTCSTKAYGRNNLCDRYGYSLGWYTGYWEVEYDVQPDFHYLVSDVQGTTLYGLTGTFDVKSNPYHAKGQNNWVSDGGTTKTYVDINAKIDDAKYYSAQKDSYRVNTSGITIDGKAEVTHQLTINPVKWGVGDFGFYVKANAVPDETTLGDHIASYDFYLLKGQYDDATAEEFADIEKGHSNAICLSDYNDDTIDPQGAPALAAEDAGKIDTHINAWIHAEDFGAPDPDGNYTLFVRTNYTPESGLEPTFHALTLLSNPTVTGIDEIRNDDCNWTVKAANGAIVVEGAEGALVEVYTTAGVQVYKGSESEIAVAPGLYIVRIGDNATKLAVR